MKLLKIYFVEIQKAMEDVSRDAFDYFLDLETGGVITISADAIESVNTALYKGRDELVGDEEELEGYDMPEWIENEIELAIKIFSEKDRYVHIPERDPHETYSLMKEFIDGIDELYPHEKLSGALDGKGAFSRFKKVLADYPVYREKWFAFNAKAMKKTITEWIESLGIKPEQVYY